MEQQPIKTISISGGEVKVSPMVEPVKLDAFLMHPSNIVLTKKKEVEAFEASFYPVENPELVYPHFRLPIDAKEGVYYPAPEGLTFTVKELCSPVIHHGTEFAAKRRDNGCAVCHGECRYIYKLAVVTFSEPKPMKKHPKLEEIRKRVPQSVKDEVEKLAAEKPKITGGYQPENTVDTSNPPRQSAAEKEEKPDLEKDSILIFKSDGVQVFIVGLGQLQKEITTLRAQVKKLKNGDSKPFDLEESIKAFNKFMDEIPEETMNEIVKEVNATGIEGPTVEEYFTSLSPQYVAHLRKENERLRARIAELEKKQ